RHRRWIELFSDYDREFRYHPGNANIVADALSRKERIKPKRIIAINMTFQSSIKDKILAAQKEASDEPAEMQQGIDKLIKRKSNRALYYLDRIWDPSKGDVRTLIMDEAHKSKYFVYLGADKMYYDLKDMTSSGHDAIWVIVNQLTKSAHFLPMRKDYKMDTLARLYLDEIVARHGPELVQETTDKISQIKDRLKVARDHQKSYEDKRRKPLEFSVGEHVLLKVSSWKGVVRFGKKGKLVPRFVGPFEITKRIGLIPLDKIQVDARLNFVEEPIRILEREFKKLKRSRIAIVKVRCNSKRGPEFTWEREDQMKLKYPHLFSSSTS
ncbi:hypothetical protein Tco_0911385, partial [Tanacetum coccineum]